jgi:hypothetical protein
MHFGTFQLTTEGIDEPARALEAACRARRVPLSRFRVLEFGESLRLERPRVPLMPQERDELPGSTRA